MDGLRPVPTVNEMVEAMRWAADFVYNVVDFWPDWTWASGESIDADALNSFNGKNVINATDPGFANWLDNQGYSSGIVSFRNVMAGKIPDLRTRVIPLNALAQQLTHSKRITREERIEQLHRRFDVVRRRYRI